MKKTEQEFIDGRFERIRQYLLTRSRSGLDNLRRYVFGELYYSRLDCFDSILVYVSYIEIDHKRPDWAEDQLADWRSWIISKEDFFFS